MIQMYVVLSEERRWVVISWWEKEAYKQRFGIKKKLLSVYHFAPFEYIVRNIRENSGVMYVRWVKKMWY